MNAYPRSVEAERPGETRYRRQLEPPTLPANWYILANSREIKAGRILCRNLADREIVLFRSAKSGEVRAFAAHCAHMGCHLKHATVIGDDLRCALHFRRIGPDGVFRGKGGAGGEALAQQTYPVAERYGVVLVYAGDGAPPDLPLPRIAVDADFLAKPAGAYRCATPWQGLIANGCDIEHLSSVHHRVLKEDVVVSRPDSRSYRIDYRTSVVGSTLGDRLIKWLSGNDVRASITVIGGSTILVESRAARTPSFLMLSMCPQPGGGTMVRGVIGLVSRRTGFLGKARLEVARWLFKSFLRKDFAIFDGLRWHPPSRVDSSGDRMTQQLYEYFVTRDPAFGLGGGGAKPRGDQR